MKQFTFTPFPTLKTERLILRQLEMYDSELIFEYQSKKENYMYTDMPIYTSIEEAENYITRMNSGIAENKWINWAIADIHSNKILGTICIWNISIEEQKAELGCALFPGNPGKGIMTEAFQPVVEFGFKTLGLKNLEAYTNSQNTKSIALCERNHFQKKSSFEETTSTGETVTTVIYSRQNNG